MVKAQILERLLWMRERGAAARNYRDGFNVIMMEGRKLEDDLRREVEIEALDRRELVAEGRLPVTPGVEVPE